MLLRSANMYFYWWYCYFVYIIYLYSSSRIFLCNSFYLLFPKQLLLWELFLFSMSTFSLSLFLAFMLGLFSYFLQLYTDFYRNWYLVSFFLMAFDNTVERIYLWLTLISLSLWIVIFHTKVTLPFSEVFRSVFMSLLFCRHYIILI